MNKPLQRAISQRVDELRIRTRERYQIDIKPAITYTTRGTTAGYAIFDTNTLDFNIALAAQNENEFVTQIVGHEFCHLVTNEVYSHCGHGAEWKEVMRDFNLQPDRLHRLDVRGMERVPKTYPYKCDCNVYTFGKPTHHKLQSKLHQCDGCNGLVKFIGPASDVRRYKVGTKEYIISNALRQYHVDRIPYTEQMMLLIDFFGLSLSTAKNYYYKLRPF